MAVNCCSAQQCNGFCSGWGFRAVGLGLSTVFMAATVLELLTEADLFILAWLICAWAMTDVIIQCTVLPGWAQARPFFIGKTIADSVWVGLLVLGRVLEFVMESGGPGFLRVFRIVRLYIIVRFILDIIAVVLTCKRATKQTEPANVVVGQPVTVDGQKVTEVSE